MSDELYRRLGRFDLGDLTRARAWLERLAAREDLLGGLEFNASRELGLDLGLGRDVKISNRQTFYSIEGASLRRLFDDWDGVHARVESLVGRTLNDHPTIVFSRTHIQRHTDMRREAVVNVGIWNTPLTTTCFWRDGDLAGHLRYEVGEAVLLNVKEQHSVVFDDYDFKFAPRAVFNWSCPTPYAELRARLGQPARAL